MLMYPRIPEADRTKEGECCKTLENFIPDSEIQPVLSDVFSPESFKEVERYDAVEYTAYVSTALSLDPMSNK